MFWMDTKITITTVETSPKHIIIQMKVSTHFFANVKIFSKINFSEQCTDKTLILSYVDVYAYGGKEDEYFWTDMTFCNLCGESSCLAYKIKN